MTKTQLKALKHASQLLNETDTSPVYSKLSSTLMELKVNTEIQRNVLRAYQEAIGPTVRKISEAKDWIDTILSDENNQ